MAEDFPRVPPLSLSLLLVSGEPLRWSFYHLCARLSSLSFHVPQSVVAVEEQRALEVRRSAEEANCWLSNCISLKRCLRRSDMFPSRTCQKKTLPTVQSQWQPRCQTARHGQLKSGVQTNQALHVCERHKLCCRSSPQLDPLATGIFLSEPISQGAFTVDECCCSD